MLLEQLSKETKTIKRAIVPTEMVIRSSCSTPTTQPGGYQS
jgi:DNA-binding LacI/PurR family transcriptional regulator